MVCLSNDPISRQKALGKPASLRISLAVIFDLVVDDQPHLRAGIPPYFVIAATSTLELEAIHPRSRYDLSVVIRHRRKG
jgi:hypothetical protein